jgi:hypothetical protein
VPVLPAPVSERPEPVLDRAFILATVATVFEVDPALLLRRTRSKPVQRTRAKWRCISRTLDANCR